MREVRCFPSADDVHDIAYFRRRIEDDPQQSCPGREFRSSCPVGVQARFDRVLIAVAEAPPTKYSGGGYWEAMHGEMTGFYEVRIDSQNTHYRMFCLLDLEALDERGNPLAKPLLTVIGGGKKQRATKLSDADYAAIRKLADEYRQHPVRSLY